jgi:rhodanese-related sulfurtransferase
MNLLSSIFSPFSPHASGVRRVAPAEAAQLVTEGRAVLVDVREPAEWSDGVAAPAALLPLSDLTGARRNWKLFLDQVGGREIILYCRSGSRSGHAARLLAAEGFRTANAGGFGDWRRAGLPVRKPDEPSNS